MVSTQPYALAKEEGQAVWFLDSLLLAKATGEQTGGAFGLIDIFMPPGGSPFHLHHNEDEAFYVYEGEMTFYIGRKRSTLSRARGSMGRASSLTGLGSRAIRRPGCCCSIPRRLRAVPRGSGGACRRADLAPTA